jgi:hypothetical protein
MNSYTRQYLSLIGVELVEKSAALIGGGIGAVRAPEGGKMEGLARGGFAGASTAVGAGLGGGAGAGLGALGGGLVGSLVAKLVAGGDWALADKITNNAAGLGLIAGGVAGGVGGGVVGFKAMRGLMGPASWDRDKEQQEKVAGDYDLPGQQMSGALNAFKNPLKHISNVARAGGDTMGGVGTGLLEAAGATAGGVGGAALGGGKSKLLAVLAGLGGGYLGAGTGGAMAQGVHNSNSRRQFNKLIGGAFSESARRKMPQTLLDIMEKGKAKDFAKALPRMSPRSLKDPYVKSLMDTQIPKRH